MQVEDRNSKLQKENEELKKYNAGLHRELTGISERLEQVEKNVSDFYECKMEKFKLDMGSLIEGIVRMEMDKLEKKLKLHEEDK